jgi:mannose-6-phosphate isomerase
MVWGGRRLASRLGKLLPSNDLYGESWELSDHALHRSVARVGVGEPRTLRQLLEMEPDSLFGSHPAPAVFPWLVKLLDANDWLSVQVHPDEEAARRLWPGEGGKTEAWFVLDAAPGSRIYAGLLPGVDESALRNALARGAVADCLHSFEPQPGDCLFLPAGTVHAVGGGVLMAEVQQTSDATFRLFDWNRRDAQGKGRTLHVEESMACIDWDRGPVTPRRVEGYNEAEGGWRRQRLVECEYFELDYLQSDELFDLGGTEQLQAAIVLDGTGRLTTPRGDLEMKAGQTWLLPASLPTARCVPTGPLRLLLSSLPQPPRR